MREAAASLRCRRIWLSYSENAAERFDPSEFCEIARTGEDEEIAEPELLLGSLKEATRLLQVLDERDDEG
jgi:hypothetical protein